MVCYRCDASAEKLITGAELQPRMLIGGEKRWLIGKNLAHQELRELSVGDLTALAGYKRSPAKAQQHDG